MHMHEMEPRGIEFTSMSRALYVIHFKFWHVKSCSTQKQKPSASYCCVVLQLESLPRNNHDKSVTPLSSGSEAVTSESEPAMSEEKEGDNPRKLALDRKSPSEDSFDCQASS